MKRSKRKWIKENHALVSVSLIALSLLLWNLDRYLPICPWGAIPGAAAILYEMILFFRK